jgi:hypothetical protein
MKNEFMIYKQGITDKKIIICSKIGEPFDRTAKIQKYILLGFTIYDMNGNEIKN